MALPFLHTKLLRANLKQRKYGSYQKLKEYLYNRRRDEEIIFDIFIFHCLRLSR